jgi:hypothetical protein
MRYDKSRFPTLLEVDSKIRVADEIDKLIKQNDQEKLGVLPCGRLYITEWTKEWKKLKKLLQDQKRFLVLENNILRVTIMPEDGGRIVEMTDKRKGCNHLSSLSTRSDMEFKIWLKGIAGWQSGTSFDLGGYVVEIWCKDGWKGKDLKFAIKNRDIDKKTVTMEAELGALQITRQIKLNGNEITIRENIFNKADQQKEISLRISSQFAIGGDNKEQGGQPRERDFIYLFQNGKKSGVHEIGLAEDIIEFEPCARYALVDKAKDLAVLGSLDPDKTKKIRLHQALDRYTLELVTGSTIVKPSSEMSFIHKYSVWTQAKEVLDTHKK